MPEIDDMNILAAFMFHDNKLRVTYKLMETQFCFINCLKHTSLKLDWGKFAVFFIFFCPRNICKKMSFHVSFIELYIKMCLAYLETLKATFRLQYFSVLEDVITEIKK